MNTSKFFNSLVNLGRKLKFKGKDSRAFTVVEIILAISVLGILTAIVFVFIRGNQDSASLGRSFTCGDTVTFVYKGSSVTYGTVGHNGKCWLDRNLGATQVATAFDDSAAYGDLFQWGRLDDGHQTRNSLTTTTLSTSSNPGHGNFIYGIIDYYDDGIDNPYDWVFPQIESLWQGVSGTNNPCPSGWRIPTEAEWTAERTSWSQNNYNGAFASPLKLTAAGCRNRSSASVGDAGVYGFYWCSAVSVPYSRVLDFYSGGASMDSSYRASGFSVRCVKD